MSETAGDPRSQQPFKTWRKSSRDVAHDHAEKRNQDETPTRHRSGQDRERGRGEHDREREYRDELPNDGDRHIEVDGDRRDQSPGEELGGTGDEDARPQSHETHEWECLVIRRLARRVKAPAGRPSNRAETAEEARIPRTAVSCQRRCLAGTRATSGEPNARTPATPVGTLTLPGGSRSNHSVRTWTDHHVIVRHPHLRLTARGDDEINVQCRVSTAP